MKKEYDFSKLKELKNPYAGKKKAVVINFSPEVLDYFKGLAVETGHPYQKLIDLYLLDCARKRKKLASTISSKGQITVPLEIRKRLGLKVGDRVEFVVENDRTTIRPARAAENPFLKYVGALPAFASFREGNAWVRALRDDES